MSARRLAVLVQGLPPDSYYAHLAAPQAPERPDSERKLAPVKCLEDIPVAKSMADVRKFVNADGDEFSETFGQAG